MNDRSLMDVRLNRTDYGHGDAMPLLCLQGTECFHEESHVTHVYQELVACV